MVKLFHDVSFKTSRLVTSTYSTSFTIGVKCLDITIRDAIYSIYGFVRLADEIVDSFHGYDQKELLELFEQEYYLSMEKGISLNPVLNSFLRTVKQYNIDDSLVQTFLRSMYCDLYQQNFTEHEIGEYIHGSAEVVGLMCLKVFVDGDEHKYNRLKPYAMRLGAAFQKINFLRDLKHDTGLLHRTYFPILAKEPLNERTKEVILNDIFEDYTFAEKGILQLPDCARLGVYTAYLYYRSLTRQIQQTKPERLLKERIRVSNMEKMALLCKAYLYTKLQ